MKYFLLLILILFIWKVTFSQNIDSSLAPGEQRSDKAEILSSGFIDLMNSGQVNASARLIRLFIGEPDKFVMPVSVFSGVSSNNFQNQFISPGQVGNDQLACNFINPLSGLINISIDATCYPRSQKTKFTKVGFLFQHGIRMLTGFKSGIPGDPFTGKPVNFLNKFGVGGVFFQTGAWDMNDQKNKGVFWMTWRYIICHTRNKQLKMIFPDLISNGLYHGWSVGWGIEINNLVNIKFLYYHYEKAPEFEHVEPIYQFSFHYSLKN